MESQHKNMQNQNGVLPKSTVSYTRKTWWKEAAGTLRLAWGLVIALISQMYMQPVAIMFGGRLSTKEMDAIALSNTTINVFGASIVFGLSSACDTILPQTFGSANKKEFGVYFQKSLVVFTLSLLPCIAVQLVMPRVLLAIGQDTEVVQMVDTYLLMFIPGLFAMSFYIAFRKYLECQAIVLPNIIIGISGIVLHIILQYVMIFELKWALTGSVLAQVIAYFMLTVSTMMYILLSGIYKPTWAGWDRRCFGDWSQFRSLGIHGILMMCLEWWAYEIVVLSSGVLGTVDVAVSSLVMNLMLLFAPFAIGFSNASCIRIGHTFGAGNPTEGKAVAKVGIVVVGIIAAITLVIFLSVQNKMALIFTNIPEVLDQASEVIPVLAVGTAGFMVSSLGRAVMRAAGKQALGSFFLFIAFYLVGLPIGLPLMLLTPLGVKGAWIGFVVALLLSMLFYLIYLVKADWTKFSDEAAIRSGMKTTDIKCDQENLITEDTALTAKLKEEMNYNSTDNIHHTHLDTDDIVTRRTLLRKLLVILGFVGILLLGIIFRFVFPLPAIVTTTGEIAVNSTSQTPLA